MLNEAEHGQYLHEHPAGYAFFQREGYKNNDDQICDAHGVDRAYFMRSM